MDYIIFLADIWISWKINIVLAAWMKNYCTLELTLSRLGFQTGCLEFISGFTQSVQVNTWIIPQIDPRAFPYVH